MVAYQRQAHVAKGKSISRHDDKMLIPQSSLMSDSDLCSLDSIPIERKLERQRLAYAVLASIAIHVGMAIVDVSGGLSGGSALVSNRAQGGAPAALDVRLASYRRALAELNESRREHVRLPPITAPLIETGSHATGEAAGSSGLHSNNLDQKPGLAVPTYLPPKALSQPPEILSDLPESDPESSTIAGSGRVIIVVFINERGAIDKLEVEQSSVNERLRDIAISRIRQAVFAPGEIDGIPVKSRVRIEVLFRPLLTP
jgi:TonB family protein